MPLSTSMHIVTTWSSVLSAISAMASPLTYVISTYVGLFLVCTLGLRSKKTLKRPLRSADTGTCPKKSASVTRSAQNAFGNWRATFSMTPAPSCCSALCLRSGSGGVKATSPACIRASGRVSSTKSAVNFPSPWVNTFTFSSSPLYST
uniref:Uncharacterized protein n=1 Tax=Ixodes ricinus TaxID=34613 RepID=A0A6B0UVJ3_IXORI